MKRFADQVVVITGAANGIGQACAHRFAEEGARVACLDIAVEANEATVADCQERGSEAIAVYCNITEPDSVQTAVRTARDLWGRIDILVHAAGIYTGTTLWDVPLSQWQRTLEINLTGTFLINQAVAPVLIAQRGGSIINVSSMAGKTSWPASAEYSATKSGVIGLTRSVAMELAPYGVTVNAICPGNTLTEMVQQVAQKVGEKDGLTGEEWLQQRASECPLGRLAEPWEMAGVIAFLASADARYLTGQAIEVDGGMVMS